MCRFIQFSIHASRFNTFDIVTVSSFLNAVAQPSPVYSQEGNAFTRSGDTFTGDFANQIVGLYGEQHVSNEGCARVRVAGPVDEVRLVLVNRASHSTPTMFQTGQQTWSFSVSDLSFDYDGAGNTTGGQFVGFGAVLSGTSRMHVELARSGTGDLILKTSPRFANQGGAWQLESSTDLLEWTPWSASTPVDATTTWWLDSDSLDARRRYFRFVPLLAGLE